MFENIMKIFKKMMKKEDKSPNSKNMAKERLHLVLVQDRANVSADFLELMKQEIIEVIKKYIEVDENLIDVRLTNHGNDDGTNGAPALYANIPIKNIKEAARKVDKPKEDNNEKKNEDASKLKNEDKSHEKDDNIEQDTENKKEDNTENKKEISQNINKEDIKNKEEQEDLKEKNEDKEDKNVASEDEK